MAAIGRGKAKLRKPSPPRDGTEVEENLVLKLEELTLGTLLTGGADLSGEVGGGEAYEAARGNPPCSSTSARGEAGLFSA